MVQTEARIKKERKNFEILVDLDEALKIRKGIGRINSAVLTNGVFYNLKSGEKASESDLKKEFGTSDFMQVAEKIIKQGEVVLPSEFLNKEQGERFKQVVDFLSQNATSPDGKPYTADRIEKAMEEARVNVKNKPIDSQISEIIEKLSVIIPIKIEVKKLKVMIPAIHSGRAYGIINEYKESENWQSNGDLVVVLNVPAGLIMDFYDKLNGVTHGAGIVEEMK